MKDAQMALYKEENVPRRHGALILHQTLQHVGQKSLFLRNYEESFIYTIMDIQYIIPSKGLWQVPFEAAY